MFRIVCLCTLLIASGCTDWPDVDTARPTRAAVDWPELVPISSLPGPSGTDGEAASNDQLLARAEALRARAALLRRPVPDADAFERLRGRLAR